MKGLKTISIEKIDVQKLTGDELIRIKKFGKSKEFEILKKIAEEAKIRRAFEALKMRDVDMIATFDGINIGVDFILDSIERAKEELKNRGDIDIDKDSK
jgi:hypothetical protein